MSTDQITAVAAEEIFKLHNGALLGYSADLRAIIKSAIEKAIEREQNQGATGYCGPLKPRAALTTEFIDETDPNRREMQTGKAILAAHASGEYRDKLRSNQRTSHLTHSKPDSASTGKLWQEIPEHEAKDLYDYAYMESTGKKLFLKPAATPSGGGRARTLAKAILADGKWSHNHYTLEEMEDLIVRVIEPTPSGGGKEWKYEIDGTDSYIRVFSMDRPDKTLFWITELAEAKNAVNAHNAELSDERELRAIVEKDLQDELKSRDFGNDTKRLDWLLDMISASSTNTAFEIFGAVHNRFTREHIDAMQETHRGDKEVK